nr:4'-phosphopantetheinyl transferase superfamily protein [Rhodoblastus acidophilus]
MTRLGLFDGRPESRRAALLDFCSEILGVARSRLGLAHDPLGAPLLLVDGAPGEWSVSSSSREDVCLFGLARSVRIGVDVEIVRPIEPPDVALHLRERTRLTGAPIDAFYELWTLKEAYVKALGVGFRRDLAQIEVLGAAPVLREFGRPVALADARLWRERVGAKTVMCAALTL